MREVSSLARVTGTDTDKDWPTAAWSCKLPSIDKARADPQQTSKARLSDVEIRMSLSESAKGRVRSERWLDRCMMADKWQRLHGKKLLPAALHRVQISDPPEYGAAGGGSGKKLTFPVCLSPFGAHFPLPA